MVLLKRIHDLELKIDNFLVLVSESGIIFEQFIKSYLHKKTKDCEIKAKKLKENERHADDLRIQIEKYVYSNLLIPENRGDVLAILEGTDNVVDQIKEIGIDLFIEQPQIPENLLDDFMELLNATANCVDELVKSVRAFFYNIHEIANNINKVVYFEKEADDIADRIKTKLYQSDASLAEKNHLKFFIKEIEKISDFSQDVADRLVIYTIKREL